MISSSAAVDIENFERKSLNNLLLKSKGAPYEEALRRIINQKLYVPEISESRAGIERNGEEQTRYHMSEKNRDRKDDVSSNNYHLSNMREGHEKRQDNSNGRATHSSSSSLQNQRQAESSRVRSVGVLEQHNYGKNNKERQSESAFRAGVSSSMQEFQYWLNNNKDGDTQNEYQVWSMYKLIYVRMYECI